MIQLSRRTIVFALAAFLAVAGLAAVSFVRTLAPAEASHRFSDVGTGTFFHNSTAWLADNGIADGFSDGTFRTGGNITRGQASYWFGNYNNSIELVSTTFEPVAAGDSFTHQTDCPTGKRAISGGGSTSEPDLFITDSLPNFVGQNPGGWFIRWESDDNASVNPDELRVTTLCVPQTIP